MPRVIGHVTPASDNGRVVPAVIEEQGNKNAADSARKVVATATARAARLGIEVKAIAPEGWLLRHALGATIGQVHGIVALTAAVAGFEAACADVQQLVGRLARGGRSTAKGDN